MQSNNTTTSYQNGHSKPLVDAPSGASHTGTPSEAELQSTAPGHYRVIRRNGKVTSFDRNKITVAVTKAFLAVEGGEAAASTRVHDTVKQLSTHIEQALTRNLPDGGTFHIEDIQDQVELALMRGGHHKVARSYVLYRERRAQERAEKQQASDPATAASENASINITDANGNKKPLDIERLTNVVNSACAQLESVEAQPIIDETLKNLYDGVPENDVATAVTMSARTLIEREPNYTYVAARLLLDNLRCEVLSYVNGKPSKATQEEMSEQYAGYFERYIKHAAHLELIDPKLAKEYDLKALGKALEPARDYQFTYLGLQTLYDRYFIHTEGTRIELPQAFFMRVAMGLATEEADKTVIPIRLSPPQPQAEISRRDPMNDDDKM